MLDYPRVDEASRVAACVINLFDYPRADEAYLGLLHVQSLGLSVFMRVHVV